MNKKMIVVSVIAVVIVALVIGVFAMSAGAPKTDTQTLLTINGKGYTVDEFNKYAAIKSEANGDITKARNMTSGDKETMLNDYMQEKMYLASAEKKGITAPSGEVDNYKSEYASKSATLSGYGVTEEDYISYKENDYKINELKNNFSNYYELPSEYYNQFVAGYSGDELKSYAFRIMSFNYEAPKEDSGDVEASGETSVSGETEATTNESGEEEKEDKSKEAVLAKAQNIREQLVNSGDFEALAKENGSYRIAFKGSAYTLVNGDLEYAVYPVLESKIGNAELYEKFKALNVGEITEIVDDAENNMFYLAKLENVEDGFVGEAETEVKQILLSQYQETLIANENTYDINMTALRLFYFE